MLGWHIGEITVHDRGDGVATVADVFTQKVDVSNGFVTGTATGLSWLQRYIQTASQHIFVDGSTLSGATPVLLRSYRQ